MNADGSGLRNLTHEWGLDGIPVWSPDGQKIAFTSKRDGTWALRPERGRERAAEADAQRGARILGAQLPGRPTGGRSSSAATATARQQRRDLRHRRRRQRATEADAKGQRPLWSPDGQQIAFRSKRNGNDDIYVMNPDGSGQRDLTRNPARVDDSLAWSPVQK